MPEAANNLDAKDYGIGIPQRTEGFFLKGLAHLDWGMKDRLARIFNPKSGHTVMLAFDHGYIMGPTSGLERMDLTIVPLIPYADCLMCTRGALRQIVPPTCNKPISLRASAGSTVLTESERRVHPEHGGMPPPERLDGGRDGGRGQPVRGPHDPQPHDDGRFRAAATGCPCWA